MSYLDFGCGLGSASSALRKRCEGMIVNGFLAVRKMSSNGVRRTRDGHRPVSTRHRTRSTGKKVLPLALFACAPGVPRSRIGSAATVFFYFRNLSAAANFHIKLCTHFFGRTHSLESSSYEPC